MLPPAPGSVLAVAWAPDGKQVLTDSEDKTALTMYLEQLKADGYSRSHRARVKVVVSGFARWLIEEKGVLRPFSLSRYRELSHWLLPTALAPYVVDGLLYHETDLKIREHYTDTGGYTEQVFATLSMLGFRFAPRIRHLSDLCLYALEPPETYPALATLIRGTVNLKRLEMHWNDIVRFGASIQQGTVTASLILRKLAAYPRQIGQCSLQDT